MKKTNKNKLLKVLKRIIFIAVLVVAFFVFAACLLGKVYEDKIEQIVISEINKNLNSEVSVGDIEFSLLKDFPYATFFIYDVVAM
ncbi:MAG: hypothetical protein K8S00_13850, partial [Bacteroidales bacterium]|nr:hypothetical protein [Bacteroidales bacterium]